jgi:hypothetical protein
LCPPYTNDIIDKTYRIEAAMEQLAQGLASLGRNGDSMLVHMTPKEVQGLQQLALAKGGSLTINPQTGLPEAGFLSDVFEFAAPVLGGLAFGPIGAGLASGLNSYRKTGDWGQALVHGGLGWGLGSLGEGIEGIGENALGANISSEAQIAADIAKQNALQASSVPSMGLESGITPEQLAKNAAAMDVDYASSATGQMPSYADKMKAGFDKVTSSPSEAWNFIKENKYPIGAASLAAASALAPNQTASVGPQAVTHNLPQYTWDAVNRRYVAAPPRTYTTFNAAGGGSVPNTFPQSNIEQMAYSKSSANPMPTNVVGIPSSDYDARINQQGDVFTAAAGAYVPKSKTTSTEVYKETFDPESAKQDADLMALIAKLSRNPDRTYAGGGIASLGGEYAAGGKLLKGPGDGMSDSIPAVIKGAKPQRAALAQGEFVVPADVVSHLGNGSTDAGAKRLYAMMDKVRMARTGNKKQGRQINPAKFMPA